MEAQAGTEVRRITYLGIYAYALLRREYAKMDYSEHIATADFMPPPAGSLTCVNSDQFHINNSTAPETQRKRALGAVLIIPRGFAGLRQKHRRITHMDLVPERAPPSPL
jgi:hypothetical protein